MERASLELDSTPDQNLIRLGSQVPQSISMAVSREEARVSERAKERASVKVSGRERERVSEETELDKFILSTEIH
jgi:hypothetical protein